jgi:glyoxylase-like metal-dependent hydrolase (beta-lactamase superfamily II)
MMPSGIRKIRRFLNLKAYLTTGLTVMLNLPSGLQVIERGWLSSNVIVATGLHNTAVVDSGYCTHAEQTVELVNAAIGDKPLTLLLNTHLHSDHCGGNSALQAAYPQLHTLIPPGHAPYVAEWNPHVLTHAPTGQMCPRFQYQDLLVPGHEIMLGEHRWQIHAAAGHDPHSIVLFEPVTRTLISADALWENGFGVVFPELEGEDAFDAVEATFKTIEQLKPQTVIPGHGRVFEYSDQILQRGRDRLAAFRQDPIKHARHGVKVLLKFKLLEVQRQETRIFKNWALGTRYFDLVQSIFFNTMSTSDMIDQLLSELVRSGVAQFNGEYVLNT